MQGLLFCYANNVMISISVCINHTSKGTSLGQIPKDNTIGANVFALKLVIDKILRHEDIG